MHNNQSLPFLPKMKPILSLIFFFGLLNVTAQTKTQNFKSIDNRVKTIKVFSADTLALKLTSPYKTDIEKVRAIFRWITENIAYDTKGYHDTAGIYKGLFHPEISQDRAVVDKDYNNRIVNKVLAEKKAICDGYSRLFKTLCDYTNLKTEIITGYIRWWDDPIGVLTKREHAWNAAFLNNKWYLLDPTWASGTCNTEVTEFKKSYNDFYFMTDPVEFFNDHYPEDSKWSLLPNTPSLEQFYNYPFFHSDLYKFKITSVKPLNGVLEITSTNKKVRIELESSDSKKDMFIYEHPFISDSITITVNNDSLLNSQIDELLKPPYKINGNRIIYEYEIKSDKADRLDVVYNNKLILSYSIRFKK